MMEACLGTIGDGLDDATVKSFWSSMQIELLNAAPGSRGSSVGNHVAEVFRNSGADSLPPELEALNKGRTEYDYYKYVHSDAAQGDYIPDEMIDRI